MTDAPLPVPVGRPGALTSLDALAAIPEEETWLAKRVVPVWLQPGEGSYRWAKVPPGFGGTGHAEAAAQ